MEAVVDGQNGRRLVLSERSGSAEDTSYLVTLTTEAGEASLVVYDYRPHLAAFVREVAESWTGFDGTKEYESLEGQLSLTCRHDGLGSVECRVTIGQVAPPEWSMTAVLSLGAGSHLQRVADSVEQFFAAP